MPQINLTSKLAQKIVDRTMKILEYNINIRDKNGKIIASGDKKRINEVCEMAAKGIRKGKVLKVYSEEAKDIKGMEYGVQIPISFNSDIIGAVDITGNPEEVEVYVGLIKTTVELMLQQAYYLKKLQIEEQAEEQFIKELLKEDVDYSNEIIENRAKVLGYEINETYLVCILEVSNFWENLLKKVGDTTSLEFQQHKKDILREIEDFFIDELKMKVFHLEGEKFIILKFCNKNGIKNIFNKTSSDLVKKLNKKFNFDYKLSVGKKEKGMKGIRKSYRESLESLELGKIFYPEKDVYYYSNQQLERIIKNLSLKTRNNLSSIFPIKELLMNTLEEYFKTDMNISKTAKKLCLHRNSIIYRLKKIYKLTNLDPRKTEDIVQLNLALLCYKYNINSK